METVTSVVTADMISGVTEQLQATITAVAPSAYLIMGIMLAIGLGMTLLKKGAKSK